MRKSAKYILLILSLSIFNCFSMRQLYNNTVDLINDTVSDGKNLLEEIISDGESLLENTPQERYVPNRKSFLDETLSEGETLIYETVSDGKSIYTELQNNNFTRKETIKFNFIGFSTTFIASTCATLYGLSNLSRKHSSKIGAFIALTTGMLSIGYCSYGLYKNYLLYKPYLPK